MISVITVSNRPHLLQQCIAQVLKQDVSEKIEHIIVMDAVRLKEDVTGKLKTVSPNLSIFHCPEQPGRYIFEKVASLRNIAIDKSNSDYIAILDDDNLWEDNHLSTLYNMLQDYPECEAAYSWRTLWNSDGTPHIVDDLYPWVLGGDVNRQKILFEIQSKAQILTPGSNLIRDKYGFKYNGDIFSCVDTGEWLLRRKLFDKVRFKEHFSYTEVLYGFCDDYLFGCDLLTSHIHVKPTEKATLRYFLGGNSQHYGHPK